MICCCDAFFWHIASYSVTADLPGFDILFIRDCQGWPGQEADMDERKDRSHGWSHLQDATGSNSYQDGIGCCGGLNRMFRPSTLSAIRMSSIRKPSPGNSHFQVLNSPRFSEFSQNITCLNDFWTIDHHNFTVSPPARCYLSFSSYLWGWRYGRNASSVPPWSDIN